MTEVTPDNAASATPVAQRFRYNGTASWCYTDTVISETVTSRDGFSNENLYSQATVDELLRQLQLASGWSGDPAVTAQTAVENANALTDIHRATVAALEAEVASLQASLDRLSGMKFSDRMHAALVSRAAAAERRVGELEAKARNWDDLIAARAETARDPDDAEWKMLARQGRKIEAVRACRALHGYSLTEAINCVEALTGADPT